MFSRKQQWRRFSSIDISNKLKNTDNKNKSLLTRSDSSTITSDCESVSTASADSRGKYTYNNHSNI